MSAESYPPPIFLLAPPRSFTSLVCGILGQHPQLYGSPELNLFRARTMRRFNQMQRLHMGMHRFVAQVYAGEQSIEAVEMAKHWMHAREHKTTAEVHQELCAAIAPHALVQKSPRYMRRLSYMIDMLEAFPKARFIHLVRHPRGMSESYLKLNDLPIQLLACLECGAVDRSGDKPIADPQILWHDYHLRVLRFQEMVHPDRWIRILGEDFFTDLDNQLHRLCDWLGVSTAPEAIAAMKRPEDSPYACFGPVNALVGNDPNFLRSPQLRPYSRKPESLDGPLSWRPDGASFHPRVVEMAHQFGYH
ncbi:MAG: sulfotransferase [Proteobacteria bacterium]|nr:sulfotransferase [Pseudomonadota bacterium]